MKRISFFLALTLVILSFGLANAEKSVSIGSIDGVFNDGVDKLQTGVPIAFNMHVTNNGTPNCYFNPSFGIVIYSYDGATWGTTAIEAAGGFLDAGRFAMGLFIEVDNITGSGDRADGDRVGLGAATIFGPGLDEGYDGLAFIINGMQFDDDDSTLHLCIDTFEFSSFAWGWSGLGMSCEPEYELIQADANFIQCWEIIKVPNLPPVISGALNLSESHCGSFSEQYTAEDPDATASGITFSMVSGPGSITPGGLYTYSPTLADVNTSLVAVIQACEDNNAGICGTFTINLEALNDAPTVADQADNVSIDAPKVFTLPVSDDCSGDPVAFFVHADGGFVGTFDASLAPQVTITADEPAGLYTVVVGVTDGKDTSFFNWELNVTAGATYQAKIEKTHLTPQGQFVDVAVYLETGADMGGFNFLMAYDASALTFQGASVENSYVYQECSWEYFTYRFGPDGNCGNGCPSGLVRVVGLAETNNGPDHPTCYNDPYDVDEDEMTEPILFEMSFLVTNDRTYECMYVPIRFFWIECGDNTISNVDGTKLFINVKVMDFEFEADFANYLGEMPTYAGAPTDPCETSDKVSVERDIDFTNGGVDIICSKDVDDRGDINLNGLAYEIADAVMFTNYFIEGLTAFGAYVDGATAASDVNADGLVLSVADLVYLIRVIVGDAQPYDNAFLKANPVNANWTNAGGVLSADIELGAAYVVIEGNVIPELLAQNVDMKFAFDGVNTKCLVFSMDHNAFTGSYLNANGAVVDVEMADINGNPVIAKLLPSEFSLNQNYPNPFNPTTTVEFAVPTATNYNLTIYNSLGQIVKEFNGSVEAGAHQVVWDASNAASGVYFYKLTAGDFQATKKMALLK